MTAEDGGGREGTGWSLYDRPLSDIDTAVRFVEPLSSPASPSSSNSGTPATSRAPGGSGTPATSRAPGGSGTSDTSRAPGGSRTSDGSGGSSNLGGVHQLRAQESPNLLRALGENPLPAVLIGLLLGAVFGALGAVASLGGKTTYTSTTVMLIDDPYQLATSGSSEFLDLDALRWKYAGLLNTDPIVEPIASSLHLSINSVAGALSSNVPLESLLMDVSATWSNPHEAQVLSQAAANEETIFVNTENTRYDIPTNDQISLATVDPASAAVAQAPSKSHAITLAVGLAVLGFVLGFFATQLVRYLR